MDFLIRGVKKMLGSNLDVEHLCRRVSREEFISYIEGYVKDIKGTIDELEKCIPNDYDELMTRLKSDKLSDNEFESLANHNIQLMEWKVQDVSSYLRYYVYQIRSNQYLYLRQPELYQE